MKNIRFALLVPFFLIGCNEKVQERKEEVKPETTPKLSWATADFNRINSEIFKVVKEKNPFPEANIDAGRIDLEKTLTTRQMVQIIRKKCKESKDAFNVLNKLHHAVSTRSNSDRKCHAIISADPLFIVLSKQIDSLSKKSRKLSEHAKKLRAFSNTETKKLIREYSNGKFDIVVAKNSHAILYNKNGVAIDITDALLQQITPSSLMMDSKEAENAKVKKP